MTRSHEAWVVEDSLRCSFATACQQCADDDAMFAVFRSLDVIRHVIENKPIQWESPLSQHLQQLSSKPDAFYSAACRNDTVGIIQRQSPTATSLWYARDAAIIAALFSVRETVSVIEIGGGYGGLAAVICDALPISRYAIIDLPEPLALQKRFLSSRGFSDIGFYTDVPQGRFDIAVSSCAISELSQAESTRLALEVLAKCDKGYVTWSIPSNMKEYWIHSQQQAQNWLSLTLDRQVTRVDSILPVTPPHPNLPGYFWR